jgi:replicative DNA helicase Mcm
MVLSNQQKIWWNKFLYDYYYSNNYNWKKWDIENDIYSSLSNNKERIVIDGKAIEEFDSENKTGLFSVLTSVSMEEVIQELEKELNFEEEIKIEDPTKEYKYSLKKWNYSEPKEDTDPKPLLNKNLKLGFKNVTSEIPISDTTKEEVWGKVVLIRGMIQNIGIPYTYIKFKKYECENCNYSITESFSILQKKIFFEKNRRCKYCNKVTKFEDKEEKMERIQLLVVSEKTSSGMPYTLKCIIPEDLIDSSEPDERKLLAGSEIILVGVINGYSLPNYIVKVPILNVLHWNLENEELKITNEDIQQIQEWSKKENLVDSMAQSFCPSIYGYESVKEALILACVGGVHRFSKKDKKLKRGSLHILMIGDPSSGKSTLSMFIYNYLKKSQYAVCSEMSLDYEEPITIYENNQIKIKKIGEFVENYNEKNNTQVLSINPLNFNCEWKNIKNVLKHKENRPLLRISMETGRNVTITKDHSIYVADKEGIHTKKGSELKEGDFVVIPKRIPIPENLNYPKEINLVEELLKLPKNLIKDIYLHNVPKDEILKLGKTKHKNYYHIERECIPLIESEGLPEDVIRKATISTKHIPTFISIDERLMKFLGYYIAEGYYVETKNQQYSTVFCFGNKDDELREDVVKITKEIFNLKCRKYFNRKIYEEIVINDKIILFLLKYILNVKKYASQKEIPEIVFNRPENERFAFLKAYIQGDWGVSASKKLISDLQYLGLLSGKIIGSYIQKPVKTKIRNRIINPQKNHFSLYQGMIYEILKNGIPKTLKRMNNIPTELIQYSLEKTLGFGNCNGRTKLSALKKRIKDSGFNVKENDLQFLNKISSSDLGFVKIRKIENIFQKNDYVYDISVDGNENFIGGFGGILCHNSHAGLGVALIKDPETESWMITSGVLPLAHKSIAVLDELDKANPDDIKSLNVVMEMQMLPFSKGGIHARLDSQTTVIGIANPKLSRFDNYTDLKQQVTFDEVLLSRFDLKFAFKDVADEEKDKKICERVFGSEKVETPMTSEFLFKYITFCKKFMPVLSKESYELLEKYYLELRHKTIDKSGILQITQRQFDALIRMSEAYAKLRLANETNKDDSERAIKLFENYLQSFGFNSLTGEIDIDKAEGRPSSTTRNKYYRMLEIMKGLQTHMKLVPETDFYSACSSEFSSTDVELWLKQAKKEGLLLEPTPRMYKVM